MGPESRSLLQSLSDDDLGNEAFGFATCRTITVAGIEVLAARLTYVGELGWELHVPAEHAVALHDALVSAGDGHDLRPAGYLAMDSLRLEGRLPPLGS